MLIIILVPPGNSAKEIKLGFLPSLIAEFWKHEAMQRGAWTETNTPVSPSPEHRRVFSEQV